MKVSVKKKTDDLIRLECEASAKEVNDVLNQCQVGFARQMGLQPEPDKTVAQAAEEKMGIKNLDSIIEPSAMEAFGPFALDKKNIVPAYPPKVEPKAPLQRNQPFQFFLDVMPKPQYELKSYDPVEITVQPFKADESMVDAQIAKMTENYSTYVTADPKPVEKGDACLIAMKCFEDGKELAGLTTEGRTYVAGEGYMPEGFDENILGMQPGETKTFTFEGPGIDDDFNEYTQVVEATVTVKEIQKETKPVIDDEWIKKNMPMYKNLEEFRRDIAKGMERQQREQYDNYVRQMAASALAPRFEGSIADEIYEAMRDNLVQNMRMGIQQQGMTWEDFMERNGGEQQFGMMLMLQTREMLVQGFCLDAIYRHEGMTITDEDITEACRSINPQVPPRQIREQMEGTGRGFALREAAERLKANKWLVDNAKITYAEGQPAPTAAE